MAPRLRARVDLLAVWCVAACAGSLVPAPDPVPPPQPSATAATPERSSRPPVTKPQPTTSAALPTPAGAKSPVRPRPRVAESAEAKKDNAWADSVLRALPLRDKVAQLVWPWILGDYVAEGGAEWDRLSRLVSEQHVGGFIVSVGSPLDVAVKVNALQRLSALPLLMSADLETGAGFRFRGGAFLPNAIDLGGATTFPLQMALGAAADSALAYDVGRITAEESRALGIHVAFAPVLDVNNNPANPVIGARSFSEDPVLTAKLGAAMVRGIQEHGMLATGKHFPGHGDTETNSHLTLATVSASRARLDSVELVPFEAAIDAGIGAIMTFHGFLPALDSSGVPATLSPTVMTSLLRDDLGFDGLLVSDAMDMAGVVERFGAFEAAKRAIAAGNDILLMPRDIAGTISAVVAGVSEGRYDEGRIDRSVHRVLALKHHFGLSQERLVDIDQVRRVVGTDAHVAVAATVAARAIVLAKDSLSLVPVLGKNRRPTVLSVTYARRSDLGAGTAFDAELRGKVRTLRTAFVSSDEAEPNYSSLLKDARASDVVLVGSYVNITSESATAGAPRAFVEFVDALRARGAKVIVVSFGSPYLLLQIPSVGSYAIAWGGSTASQRAAARALLGLEPITARLPISLPPLLPIGFGLRRDVQ
ncbi:MAG: glycoside hydrolase family 3 N-terminal domain-containing protein [Gemmatimonadota bacterium]